MAIDTQIVTGADRLKRRISTIRAALALPPMMSEIETLLLRRHVQRFDRQIDPNGNYWEPLAEDTVKSRKARGRNKGILHDSGELRSSIQVIRGSLGDAVYTNTGAGFRIGVRGNYKLLEKARTHQRGYPAGNIPARRFLGIGPLDVRSVDSLLRRKAAEIERL